MVLSGGPGGVAMTSNARANSNPIGPYRSDWAGAQIQYHHEWVVEVVAASDKQQKGNPIIKWIIHKDEQKSSLR